MKVYRSISLFSLSAFLITAFSFTPALAAKYYADQSNFAETSVPVANYRWNQSSIVGCIYKENGVDNSYYVWTKLAVQNWRQALREYTGNQDAWGITAHYVSSIADLEFCDIKIYIYSTYREFPEYPVQTGAYTSVKVKAGGGLDASIFLAPLVLHGDGKTEIDLPTYAFRNSAVHEVGHVLGLAHMQSQTGYLMSPKFDFWQENDQMPITTLELNALVKIYGNDGFS